MMLLVVVAILMAFAIGVAESTRIVKELHIIAGELHQRLNDLEKQVKQKI